MKFGRVIWCVCAFVAVSQRAGAECSGKFAGRYDAVIDYGGRKIFLVGANHPDGKAQDQVLDRLRSLNVPIGPRECADLTAQLSRALPRGEILDRQIRTVTSTLASIDAETHLSEIGIELSPSEWQRKLDKFKRLDAKTTAVVAKCGPGVARPLKIMRWRAYGAEWAFADEHFGVRVRPYESLSARKISFRDFKQKTTIDFDDQNGPLAKSPAFREVAEALWAERSPTDDEIKRLAQRLGGLQDETVATIRRDVKIWQARVRGAYLRDDAIVKNLRDQKTSIALVVGNRHVEDLTRKLVRDCQTQTGTAAPIAAPSPPSAR